MAYQNYPFPFDKANLLSGAVRILYHDILDDDSDDASDLAGIHSVIDMQYPYAPVAGWNEVGATKEAFSSTRGFAVEGLEIQQFTGAIDEEETDTTRGLTVSIAEFKPSLLQVIENQSSVVNVAAAADISAQKVVRFGKIVDRVERRWAFISRRKRSAGLVVEDDGRERGRFFMGVLFRAKIAADDVSIEQAKGSLTAAGVSFTGFPDTDPALDEGEEYGLWSDEQAGTIA